MATKIVLTKGLIETKEDEKDLTHGQAAHKCQRIMDAAWQKHHTVLIDSTVFDEIKGHLLETDMIYSGPYNLQVEEFGEVQVYQIADKELGLVVDPTRTKLRKQKTKFDGAIMDPPTTSTTNNTKVIAMSIALAVIFLSIVFLVFLPPSLWRNHKEVMQYIHTINYRFYHVNSWFFFRIVFRYHYRIVFCVCCQ